MMKEACASFFMGRIIVFGKDKSEVVWYLEKVGMCGIHTEFIWLQSRCISIVDSLISD